VFRLTPIITRSHDARNRKSSGKLSGIFVCGDTPSILYLEKMVVARFSLLKSLLCVAVFLAVVVPLYWLPLSNPNGPIAELKSQGVFGIAIVAGWIGGAIGARILLFLIWQLAFRGRAAIWLDDDWIVYLNKSFLKINRKQVDHVEVSHIRPFFASHQVIALHMIGGETKTIATGFVSGTADAIVSKLRQGIPLRS
jgi:hypothetical protein